MSLPPGTRIGAYEITAPLGAGGMGEVYRAKDSRLKREVALKVLPADVANDRERMARFQREAEVLASLNHPNIAQIYGIEDNALVMELVEGEDLAERLKRGAIPIDEALPIAKQIAEALEAAHEQGIIHRDLKPANVKVRPDGTVKVLDFGLAKAWEPGVGNRESGAGNTLANSPTITSPAMTMHGMILGTAAYMAPEQAKGKAVDKRADIWAFGVVLFEMLTGRTPFAGDTITDIIAEIVKSEPDWDALDATTPPRIRMLLERCLVKDVRQRLRDIGDARIALDEAHAPVTTALPATAPSWRAAAPWIVAVAATLTALAIALPGRPGPPAIVTPVRFVESVPVASRGVNPVLSPDGGFLVYQAGSLKIRPLSEIEPRDLPGTVAATMPFVSPDGRWVGFYSDGKLKKVAVDGREPFVITDVSADSPGASFVTADRILFTSGWYRAALQSVSSDGGPVTQASTLDEAAGERGHWWPTPLPGGRHALFTIWYAASGLSASRIAVLDLQNGTHRVLFPGALASYAAGHVLYYQAGQYHVAPFDPSAARLTGESRPVLPDAFGLDPTGDSNRPVSVAEHAVAYWPGELYPLMTLTWVDRQGQRTPTAITVPIEGASLSPDDQRVAAGRPQGGASQMWVYDFSGEEARLPGEGSHWGPAWHPDSRRLAYNTLRKGDYDVAIQSLDGPQEVALAGDHDEAIVDWLANGRMVVKEWSVASATSIVMIEPAGQRVPLIVGDFEKMDARVSPDGRWIAICANPTGTPAVYVRSTSARGTMQRLAAAGSLTSCNVRWSPATRELVFMRGTTLIALALQERNERIEVLRETELATVPARSELYGVSRDGERFLLGVPRDTSTAIPGIRVIVGGLPALVPTSP